jgi:NAD(P)H-dependent flavin oxidoreductase YrpB (nitropropane dioxygenase family)
VALVAEGGAAAFVAGLGVPGDRHRYLCHRHGVLVVNMCGKVAYAVRAVEAGCDVVVAQGTEAGGHTGQVATMPLVPQVVDEELEPFPAQLGKAFHDGALHLGADETAEGVDPELECYPAGQGVGGITGLVPAGEVVTRMVGEAEARLAELSAGRPVS